MMISVVAEQSCSEQHRTAEEGVSDHSNHSPASSEPRAMIGHHDYDDDSTDEAWEDK
jgi:hypothetical protein